MRILFTIMSVLALSVMGCGQELGPMAGSGGNGGVGGDGGNGGVGGDGGTGGVGGGVLTVCVPPGDEWQPCRTGEDEPGFCSRDECQAAEFSCGDANWSICADADTWPEDPGICVNDVCELLVESCTDQEDGTPCFAEQGWGICDTGFCTQEP